jgi:hypothetical protein
MTKLLEQVLADVRKLSAEEQDDIAAELIAYLGATHDDALQLSDEQLDELRRRRSGSNSSDLKLEEVEARLRRHGA